MSEVISVLNSRFVPSGAVVELGGSGQNYERARAQPMEFSQQILESLPENARQYYHEKSDRSISELVYQLSFSEKFCRTLNLLRIYPYCSMRYLNSNEFCCVVVSGEHRIYQGPGYHWVTGFADHFVGEKFEIGQDINFGPIKIIYVKPGFLKFANMGNTGRPMLLGPGMHYFNDINLQSGREISMNFHGDNQVIKVDEGGAFQFIFVKAGSEAIVITKSGDLIVFGPGLHFIQAPDTLKCFVSVQQRHFKFGSCDKNQHFLTADNVELRINATIFFRILDVRTMFTTRIKDESDLLDTVHSQAMATLVTIIRSENFHNLGQRQQIQSMNDELKSDFEPSLDSAAVATAVDEPPPPYTAKGEKVLDNLARGFHSIIVDAEPQFQRMMQSNFGQSGIEIQSLRIEEIEFADKVMQKQVSEFAINQTKLTSQQQTISAQRALQVAEAERDAATLLIRSRAENENRVLKTEADNRIKIQTAEAENAIKMRNTEADNAMKIKVAEAANNIKISTGDAENAIKMRNTEAENQMKLKSAEAANSIKVSSARAEAENKLIIAEAEAQAKRKLGEAELEIMERQNAMPNAQLRIVTDAQKEVLSGVTKVIYTDQQSMLMKPYLDIVGRIEGVPGK